ncbi:MAG: DinB family protein [Candidatus Hodarchaeota archaeon]
MTTTDVLLNQFNSSWKMVQQAIENSPQELWPKTTNDWTFSYVVYHLIETAEFYCRSMPEGMEWGKKAGINWETDSEIAKREKIAEISKEDCLNYLKEMEDRLAGILAAVNESELLEKDGFHWFSSKFEKMLYLLRHNMHHIGELNKALRDCDGDRIKWL